MYHDTYCIAKFLPIHSPTYNAVLDAEAQLKLGIWPSDNCHGDRRAVNNAELHILLALQVLR